MSSGNPNTRPSLSKYSKTGTDLEEIRYLKETFDSFDHKNHNKITTEELLEIMKKEKFDEKHPMVYQMLKDICRDDNEAIDFEEFLSLMNTKIIANNDDNLERLFNLFDKDKKGEISILDLKDVIRGLGENFSEEEIANIIMQGDVDKDGKLGYEDFCKIMGNKVLN